MTKANPMGDDFGNAWFAKTPPSGYSKRRRRDVTPARNEIKEPREPAVSFEELDEAHRRIRAIYGKQEEYIPEQRRDRVRSEAMRRGRRVGDS